MRNTAHLFATLGLRDADFTYWFADVFNGETFRAFLRRLVTKYRDRKVFLIIPKAKSGWPKIGAASNCSACLLTPPN
jgi:hypothetical protein